MDMDSWLHGYATTNAAGNNGFMCGYAASSCTPAELQFMEGEQQQFLISSQIQHHLNQISMRMNMDDEAAVYVSSNDGDMHDRYPIVEGLLDDPHHAGTCSFPSFSSSSISLPASASLSCSPASSSAHILAAPAAAAGGCNQQYPEVSSHVPLLPPPPPAPHAVPASYDHQYTNRHAPESPAKTTTGAFKHYARHLGPKRPPKPGACGQRMFKTAMSVLSKMHVAARYSQQQYYYQAAAAAEAAQPPSVNQLQHMFSERKRREKLNDSFHALRAVLPPGAKKDKTSILIRAREYVRSLEAKVAELEEKNMSLESRLTRHDGGRSKNGGSGGDDHDSGETTKVQVEITRAANEETTFTLTIAVRSSSPCNMTDVVVRTLQCLKEQIGDGVSLVAMSTSTSGGGGAGPAATGVKNASPRAVLTMQIKSPGIDWEEQPVKDAVAKVVADALTTTTTSAAATTGSSCFVEASQLIS
ncbi:putative transcription factor bHLH041 [Sorghum bicolor]|uniref:BHLH domain-containing protein n=2 Tax=Sorghum bicolor TaxID=4558 RepID=A0A1B6Q116_SORBI|nr:putative transcription factor bHLH041 [Sorghum bicolor]KXG31616.1 hypothetical protein SORBI_3003G031100 [Sorghum bicolor]|eukprot:XP_002457184.2 putative transcription factor bHLH041 [Sorghum bicolor]